MDDDMTTTFGLDDMGDDDGDFDYYEPAVWYEEDYRTEVYEPNPYDGTAPEW